MASARVHVMDRRAIVVSGTVQGVGFRPFAYRLATTLGLTGFVKNRTGSVLIEVEGAPRAVDKFLAALRFKCPPLAHIEEIRWEPKRPQGDTQFRIEPSDSGATEEISISPDLAMCGDCARELFDAKNHRYRYPFTNCTNCGPRLTIITAAPYDRTRTTMSDFGMCAVCRREYEDPDNRRFHAQPIACGTCGPRLEVILAQGKRIAHVNPLAYTVGALREGSIAAIKGLGGFHLACDARNQYAVGELRRRKQRDEKPFAVMARDVAAAEALCELSPEECTLLLSPRAPIVLLRRRSDARVAASVAPANPYLGVMLPYTPLHHLLLRELGDVPLVMTSGNRSDEPIAYDDESAVEQLAGIADFFLMHNRPIHLRCDDSVARVVVGEEMLLRRSRGYAPQPLVLPVEFPQPILALGGQSKVTIALGRGPHAILSHHLGDLDDYEAYQAYVEAVEHYERLFAVEPEFVVHDLHPDYASTTYARERAVAAEIRTLGVQHHHAHMASCMAEHGLDEPVIAVVFDGSGFGTDGAVWGGEFLIGDYRAFRRAAHFRYVAMPGGARAIHEPWRMAVAHLVDSQVHDVVGLAARLFGEHVSPSAIKTIERMIQRDLHSPRTSSVGRLFDAVAAIAGLRHAVSFEGQAAMELEWHASETANVGAYSFEVVQRDNDAGQRSLVIDTRPLMAAIVEDRCRDAPSSVIARQFHNTLVEIVVSVCRRLADEVEVRKVVLSGGVFMNVLLSREASARLTAQGLQVYRHRKVPPGDGGLSLGQLAIAAAGRRSQA